MNFGNKLYIKMYLFHADYKQFLVMAEKLIFFKEFSELNIQYLEKTVER
jgi:hypothetical protein